MDLLETIKNTCQVAGALLLQEPNQDLITLLQTEKNIVFSLEECKEIYLHAFCLSNTALFVPPFKHVIENAEERDGSWYFPKISCNAARKIEALYTSFDFDLADLNIAPALQEKFIPGDHLGIMFTFVSCALNESNLQDETTYEKLTNFVLENFKWVDCYCKIVDSKNNVYLSCITEVIQEVHNDLLGLFTIK